MDIQTVKQKENGYLVNGTISVPNSEGNRHHRLVQEWIAEGGVVEPELTQAELDTQAQDKINSDARAYLASTDWYIVRQQEVGIATPQAVLDARAEARNKIV